MYFYLWCGYVQKGPYINGTSVQIFELNSSLVQTGKVFSTQINNNKGSFEINTVILSSPYVEFSASGFYFDEVKGEISVAPLLLLALSDITDISTVNVNILTHLEKGRIEYLINHGMTFSVAKDSAQQQVLSIFGFRNESMSLSEKLDISFQEFPQSITTLSLIREVLENDSKNLRKILAEVVELPEGKRNELVDLLETTSLSNRIDTMTEIKNRLNFLIGLEQIIYDKDINKNIKERKHLHKIIIKETWIFGDEFTYGVDDVTLKNVLKSYIKDC